jgi:hypothetical protein
VFNSQITLSHSDCSSIVISSRGVCGGTCITLDVKEYMVLLEGVVMHFEEKCRVVLRSTASVKKVYRNLSNR